MTNRHVLIMILIVSFVLVFSKFGRADSIICDDLIFTETSSIEAIRRTYDGSTLRGTIPVKEIKNIVSGGARIDLHTGSEIYFDQMTSCMDIEDEVDSIKNLRWFLEKSADARISNWGHRR